MIGIPASLAAAEPLARAVYGAGWRPSLAEGPTRDELVALAASVRSRPRRRRTDRPATICHAGRIAADASSAVVGRRRGSVAPPAE